MEADFVLDTGAEALRSSGIEAAGRLGVARDEWVSTDIQGTGGRDRRRLGRPRTLSLGGIALRRRTLAADNSLVVGPIPDSIDGHPVAGLLGQDYLSLFDIELDPVANTLRLFDVAGCTGAFVPWARHAVALAASRPVRNVLLLPVHVAGRPMVAELDTGATVSVLLAPGMGRLGLAPGGKDELRGFGPASAAGRREDFVLQVDGLPSGPARLLVSPIRALPIVDLLLGADWMGRRRIWVSWSTNQVLVDQ